MRTKVVERKKRAEARDDARANRTPAQQLKKLDEKLGKGQGAVRERARLQSQIEQAV